MSLDTGLMIPKPATRAELRAWVMQRDGETCQTCGRRADEVDHVWPRYWGGPDHVDNLLAICGPCNKRKGNTVDWNTATREQIIWAIEAVQDRLGPFLETLMTVCDASIRLGDDRLMMLTRDSASVIEVQGKAAASIVSDALRDLRAVQA